MPSILLTEAEIVLPDGTTLLPETENGQLELTISETDQLYLLTVDFDTDLSMANPNFTHKLGPEGLRWLLSLLSQPRTTTYLIDTARRIDGTHLPSGKVDLTWIAGNEYRKVILTARGASKLFEFILTQTAGSRRKFEGE